MDRVAPQDYGITGLRRARNMEIKPFPPPFFSPKIRGRGFSGQNKGKHRLIYRKRSSQNNQKLYFKTFGLGTSIRVCLVKILSK